MSNERLKKELEFNVVNIMLKHDEDLKKNKINISVVNGPKVLVKFIEIKPRTAPTRIAKKSSQQIQVIKKAVKVNTDVSYILALLNDLKVAAKGLDLRDLTDEAVDAIKDNFKEVIMVMSKNTLIEYKGENNVQRKAR